MRFTPALALALASLFSTTTQACLILSGTMQDSSSGKLWVSLWDNGAERCQWQGQYNRGTQQNMVCQPGFAAWINLPAGNGAPAGTVAYAHDTFGVRFANDYFRLDATTWYLYKRLYGCTSAQGASAMSAMGMEGGDLLSLPPSVSDGSESTITSVAIKTKAARPFNA